MLLLRTGETLAHGWDSALPGQLPEKSSENQATLSPRSPGGGIPAGMRNTGEGRGATTRSRGRD